MACHNCGTDLRAEVRFCPVCGASQAPVQGVVDPPQPPRGSQDQASGHQASAPDPGLGANGTGQYPPQWDQGQWGSESAAVPPPTSARSGSRTVLTLAVVGGVVALGLLLLAGFLLFSGKSKDLTVAGKPIQGPREALDQASQQVLALAQDDANTKFTSAADYRCFFATRAGTDGDSIPVLEDVYCGPLLHEFGDAGAPFDSVALKYDTSGEMAVVQFSAKGLGAEVNQGVSADEVTLLDEKGASVSASELAPLEPPPPPTMERNGVGVYSAEGRYDIDEFEKDCSPIGVIYGGSGCVESKMGATGGSSTDARSASEGQQVATVTVLCQTSSDWTLRFGPGSKAPTAQITCSSGEFVEAIASVKPDTTLAMAIAGGAKTGPTVDLATGDVSGSSPFVEAYGEAELSLTAESIGSVPSTAYARADADYVTTGPDTLSATNPNAGFYAENEKCPTDGPCLVVTWDLYSGSYANPWLEFEDSQVDVTVAGRPAKFRIGRIYGTYTVYVSGVTPNEAQTVRVTWTPKGKLRNRDDSASYAYWTDFSGSTTVTTEIPGSSGGDQEGGNDEASY